MPRQIIIAEQHRLAAVFSEDQIQELIVATGHHQVGDVYLGVVENVLPSIDAAFVNIGNTERNGFIHVTDLGPLRLRRSSASISELVAPHQKVLVQVMKEPTGNKGPRLTGNLSFPGRYLVLMPYGRNVHLSRRIQDDEERNRLKSLAILIKPSQMGLLVRTEAEGVPEEGIIEDLEQLKKQWEFIQQQQLAARSAGLLNRDDDFIQRVLRDVYSADVNRIVTDSPLGLKRVRQALQNWNKGQMPPGVFVDAHRETTPILDYFRINAVIRQALRPRVDLPSGGYIVIEPTEALTVVDVNSGSFTQSATSRETVLWTNCEAATEIARQLRLRNIAGVIVVDFIDMDARRDQLQVLEHFNKAIRDDKSRPQIAQLSELGLVELTRKRQGQSLYEIFGRPCPTCDGLGLLTHLPGAHPEAEADDTGSIAREFLGDRANEWSDPNGDDEGSGYAESSSRSRGAKPKTLRPGLARRGRPTPRQGADLFGSEREVPLLDRTELPMRNEPSPLPTAAPLIGSTREKTLIRDKGEGRTKPPLPEKSRPEIRPELRTESARPEPALPVPETRKSRILTVEMTPLQQQVFSEMGLSPLLLLKDPVTPTRDTVVRVVLPGTPIEPEPEEADWNGDEPAVRLPDPISPRQFPPVFDSSWELDSPEELADLTERIPDDVPDLVESQLAIEVPIEFPVAESFTPPEVEPPVVQEQQSPAASRRRRSRSPE